MVRPGADPDALSSVPSPLLFLFQPRRRDMETLPLTLPSGKRLVLRERTVEDDIWCAKEEQRARKAGRDDALARIDYSIALLQRAIVSMDDEEFDPPAKVIDKRRVREFTQKDFQYVMTKYIDWCALDEEKCSECGQTKIKEIEEDGAPFDR
jgi:hypothetical protein